MQSKGRIAKEFTWWRRRNQAWWLQFGLVAPLADSKEIASFHDENPGIVE